MFLGAISNTDTGEKACRSETPFGNVSSVGFVGERAVTILRVSSAQKRYGTRTIYYLKYRPKHTNDTRSPSVYVSKSYTPLPLPPATETRNVFGVPKL